MAQASDIGKYVDVVITLVGNQINVNHCFITAFYHALGYGYSIKTAFELGLSEINLQGFSSVGRLRLITNFADAAHLPLVGVHQTQSTGETAAPIVLDGAKHDNNRLAMLQRVDKTWVEDVLEYSFQNKHQLTVRFDSWNDTLKNPWPNGVLPSHTLHQDFGDDDIQSIYDRSSGALLILGEPGAGKSTQLLLIAKVLIDRAYLDANLPIPVILHLGIWGENPMPLDDWLVAELREKYLIPAKVARSWVDDDLLLLLLDGLDEVDWSSRNECVRAINEFRDEHANSIVVCSRAAEYLAMDQKLRLNEAVFIRPLTTGQINHFIHESGLEATDIVELLEGDPDLAELAQTPLLLDILATSFRNVPTDLPESIGQRRDEVISAYVKSNYERRTGDQAYSIQQFDDWLNWLARNMNDHAQVSFLIEGLQPTWLVGTHLRWLYHVGVRLISCLMIFLVALFAGAFGDPFIQGTVSTSIVGAKVGLLLAGALLAGSIVRIYLPAIMSVAIAFFLTAGLTFFLPVLATERNLLASLVAGMVLGVSGGVAGVSIASTKSILIADKIGISIRKATWGLAGSIGLALFVVAADRLLSSNSLFDSLSLGLDVWIILAPTVKSRTCMYHAFALVCTTRSRLGCTTSCKSDDTHKGSQHGW